ncbi:MAG: sigma 54-interacting transcriptional regulator [Candidatus Eisenbacteria bacterium]
MRFREPNKLRKSLAEIGKMLGIDPVAPGTESSGDLGELYLQSSRYADAIAEFRAALGDAVHLSDADRAGLTEKLAWCYFWTGEYVEASRIAERLVGEEGKRPGMVLLEGRIALERGELPAAGARAVQALALAEKSGDPDRIGAARSLLGIVSQREGRSSEARDHYEEAMIHYRIAGDAEGECRTWIHLGTLAKSECRWEEAFRSLDRARRRAEDEGFYYLHGSASLNRGNLSYRLGHGDDAEAATREALRIFVEIGYELGAARALIALARLFLDRGAMEDFRECMDRADEMCAGGRFPRERVLIEGLEGLGATRRGLDGEGERRLTQALRIARGIARSGDLAAAAALDLADFHLERGRPDEAERLAIEMTGPLAAVGDLALEGRQRRILAETAALREEWSKAAEEIVEAVRFFERIGYHRELAKARVVAGRIEAGRQDRDDEKVLTDLLGAKRLFEEIGDVREAAAVSVELARHWMRAGAAGQARSNLEGAMRAFEKLGDEAGVTEAETLLDRMTPSRSDSVSPFDSIVTRDRATREVIDIAKRIARHSITVLIEGDTGTGKQLLAKAIHDSSPRAERPFVTINCSSLPEQLLESELFGYMKGAFTGAAVDRKGLFEEADGGTILLDEIGKAGPHVQRSLLHVLDQGMIRPVGSNHYRAVDVRVICATSNMKLREDMAADRFLKDLYYRVNDIMLRLPPLRERAGDVGLLARHFLDRYRREFDRPMLRISPAAEGVLLRYAWPGNVRELEKSILRAVLLAPENTIDVEHLSAEVAPAGEGFVSPGRAALTLKDEVEALEKRRVRAALERTGGNRSQAARDLGLSLRGLRNKIRRYELERPSRDARRE